MKRFFRKGEGWSMIKTLLFAAILIIIGYAILKGPLGEAFNFINDANPKISYNNEFNFTAQKLSMDYGGSGCTVDQTGFFYACEQKEVSFSVNILNLDQRKPQRSFNAGVAICESECDRRGECTPKDSECLNNIAASGQRCTVRSGEEAACDAGKYALSSGTYNVYPIAECLADQDIGCDPTGLLQQPRSLNQENYLTITVN